MRNLREFLNSRKGKITVLVIAVILAIIAVIGIAFAAKLITAKKETILPIESGDKAQNHDKFGDINLDDTSKITQTIEELSGDLYEINNETSTITFHGDNYIESFCVTSNPNGPSSEDEWITFDGNNSYNFLNENIVENEEQGVKVYVRYLAKVDPWDPEGYFEVRGKFYSTLAEAYDEAAALGTATIKVHDDVEDSSTFTVASGKDITLDFNGNTIVKTGNVVTINEGGILRIKGEGDIRSDLIKPFTVNGTLYIEKGMIQSTSIDTIFLAGSNAKLYMSGGAVINTGGASTFHCINMGEAGCEVNITGGLIEANLGNGIEANYGTLTIGTNDGKINKDSPIIKSGRYAISQNDLYTTVNFYDGTLKGVTKATFKEISNIVGIGVNSTEIIGEETYKTYYLTNGNYYVDGSYYSTLSDAYESAATLGSATIRVENNVSDSSSFTVEDGKDITLDLNGHTITKTSSVVTVNGGGTLRITGEGGITSTLSSILTVKGNLYVEKATIETTGAYAIYANSAAAKVYMNSGIVRTTSTSTTSYGIYMYSSGCVINITGGLVESIAGRGIHANNGTLNMGEAGGELNSINPVIIGGVYGIYKGTNGTVNFYDGIIKGASAAKSGTFSNLDGLEVNSTEIIETVQYNTYYLSKGYSVKGTYYSTLAEAYTAAAALGTATIKVEGNMGDSSTFTVASGKDITIDLNGYTINKTSSVLTINNGGILRIKGEGGITSTLSKLFTVNGTLYIENGTIETSNSYLVYVNAANAKVYMSGGKLGGPDTSYGIYAYYSGSEVQVTGGTIEAANGISVNRGAIVTIGEADGKIDKNALEINGRNYGIRINGGTVNFYDGIVRVEGSTDAINGELSSTEGYRVNGTEIIDGVTYSTCYLSNGYSVNGTYYGTLESAYAAADALGTATIKLEGDMFDKIGLEGITVASGKDITFDLNGHTFTETTTNQITVDEGGILRIKGEGLFSEYLTINGSLYLEDGTIETTATPVRIKSGSARLYMSSGTIRSTGTTETNYALESDSSAWGCEMHITGGLVESTNADAIYAYRGDIVLGTDGGAISKTSPVIKGKNYAISGATGVINMYDGILIGGTAAKNNLVSYGEMDSRARAVNGIEVIEGTVYRTRYLAGGYSVLMAETYKNAYTNKYILGNDEIAQRRADVLTITLQDNQMQPNGTLIKSWDVSLSGDGSVIAWLIDDESGTGNECHLYIGGNGEIIASAGQHLFWNYTNCTNIYGLSLLDTSRITSMQYMFSGCNSVVNLDVSKFNTSQVTNMRDVFSNCFALTTLDVSNFDTSNVTNMYQMFGSCWVLKDLDLTNFDTSNVTNMFWMFCGDDELTYLDLSSFDTTQVTDMSYMFNGCRKLNSLLLGEKFDRLNGSSIFSNWDSIKTAIITLRTTPMTIGENPGIPSGVILYVPNAQAESAFEAATNYASVFGNGERVRPILELAGSNPAIVGIGETYTDAGALVAGFTSEVTQAINYTKYGYTLSNPVIKKDGNIVSNITTSSEGTYTVEYTLNYTEPVSKGEASNQAMTVMTESRTVIVTEKNYYVNDMYYPTIADAYTAAAELGTATIEVCANVNEETVCVIEDGKDITLDLASYTITDNANDRLFTVASGGILRLKGNGKITGQAYIMEVEGTLYMEGGTLETRLYEALRISNGKAYISGGTVRNTTTKTDSFQHTAIYLGNTLDSEVNISGGLVESYGWIAVYVFRGNLNMTGGTVRCLNDNSSAYGIYVNETDMINISGGLVECKEGNAGICLNGILTIGTEGGKLSKTSPEIIGRNFAIHNYDGDTIKFYDGILKGQNNSSIVSGGIAEIEENATLVKSTETIDGVKYNTCYLEGIEPILMEEEYDNAYTNKYILGNSTVAQRRSDVLTITLQNNQTAPSGTVIATWDVSAAKDGSVTAWLIDDVTGTGNESHLYIGGNGGITASSGYYLFWGYTNCTAINDLTLLNTSKVSNMENMFSNCSALTNIDLTKFDTSSVNKMESMFSSCSTLTSIDVTKFDTSSVEKMSYMFTNCSGLVSIDVTKFNTSNVTSMSGMFDGCSNLTSLDVTKFDTSNVTSMSHIFSGCVSLTSLDVTKFDTSNVTDMMHMFSNCSSLTSLDVTKFNTSSVNNLYGIFNNCSGLTSLDVTKFDTSNVTSMGYMFNGCSGLTNLDVTNFDTSKVTNMRNMFCDCSSLISVDLSGFDANKLKFMIDMFKNCSSLEKLDLNGFNTINVTSSNMLGMFSDCSSLEILLLGENYDKLYGLYLTPKLTVLITQNNNPMTLGIQNISTNTVLYVPNEDAEAAYEAADNYAGVFGNGERVRPILELVGDNSVKVEIGGTYTDAGATVAGFTTAADQATNYTEYGYTLTGPVIKKDGSIVTSVDTSNEATYTVEYTVNYAKPVNSGETPNTPAPVMTAVRTVNVKNVEAVLMARDFKYVNANGEEVPEGTSGSTLIYYAIGAKERAGKEEYTADKIKTINILDTSIDAVPENFEATWDVSKDKDGSVIAWIVPIEGTDMYDFYFGGEGGVILSTGISLFRDYINCIEINGLNKVDTSRVKEMHYMFAGCKKVTLLDVSNFDTSNVGTMYFMFNECKMLNELDVSGFNTSNVTNMWSMFRHCERLINIDVSDFDTNNVTDMRSMFYCCKNLSMLNLSNFDTSKVTAMDYMFYNCSALTYIDVSSFDTSNITSVLAMFGELHSRDDAPSLELDLSNFNTSKVTNMSEMFRSSSKITKLNISSFDTSNVEDFSGMFSGCEGLSTLDISNFDTSKAKYLNGMFYNCSNLESLDVSKFETNSVKTMAAMFEGCSKLTHLDLSGFDTSGLDGTIKTWSWEPFGAGLAYVDSMLKNTSSLKTLILGKNFNKLNGTDMFTGCSNLATIIAQSTSPMTISTDTGISTNTVLYVPNTTAETAYEAAENYASVFNNGERVRTILELVGDNPAKVEIGGTYTDAGATVAGFTTAADQTANYTEYGYTLTGPVIKKDGNIVASVDTSNEATYTIEYTVNYAKPVTSGDTPNTPAPVMTAVRTVNVAKTIEPILMRREYENVYNENGVVTNFTTKYIIGTHRAGLTEYTPDLVKTITLQTSINIPDGAISWDVSRDENGSVMAWMIPNTEDTLLYDLYIGGNGGLIASNGMLLFGRYTNCTEINGLELLDVSRVDNMWGVFRWSSKLTSLDLRSWNTQNVTNLQCAFTECSRMESVNVSGWDTSRVDNMNYLFHGCFSLNLVDLTGWNTSNVKYMTYLFEGCRSLTNLDISHFDTSSAITMSLMFKGCSSLTNLDVSNFNTSNVTNMKEMFRGCTNLTSLDVDDFNTRNVEDMSYMFSECSSLNSIDVSKFNTLKVKDMSYMFNGCTALEGLDVSNFMTPNVTNMSYMFAGCEKIGNQYFEYFDTSKVTNMASMFENCKSMTNLSLVLFNTSKVENMANMFAGCSGLTLIDVTQFNTAMVKDMTGMFKGCSSLTGLNLKSFNTVALTQTVADMFNGCTSLRSVLLGKDFGKLNGMNLFNGCNSLRAIITQKAINSSAEAMELTENTGLNDMPNVVLYVANTVVEEKYEAATNYATVFGFGRIKQMMELVGDSTVHVEHEGEYIDDGVTVNGDNYDIIEDYKQYGYIVNTEGLPVDTSVKGNHQVVYTLMFGEVQ